MSIVSLTELDVKDKEAFQAFMDQNAMVHETIYNTLLGTFGLVIPHQPMYYYEGAEINKDWLTTHDQEHKAIADAIGFDTPPDLDLVDFTDQGQTNDWVNNHYLMHQNISQVLNR